MSKFCVAFFSEFDGKIEQYIVSEAADWRDALNKAKPVYVENIAHCNTMEEAVKEAFNQDWHFNVIEI